MGLLARLFGKDKPIASAAVESPPCPHITLVPKWDSVADIGHEDKASSYVCDGCHQTFTADEGRALLQSEAERLKKGFQV